MPGFQFRPRSSDAKLSLLKDSGAQIFTKKFKSIMLVQTCNASTWAPEAKGVFKATKTVLQRGTGGKVRKEKKTCKKKNVRVNFLTLFYVLWQRFAV